MMKFHAIFVTVLLLLFGLFELGMCMSFGPKNMRATKEIPTDAPEIFAPVQQHNIEKVLIC